jgi:hypothetical protein
MALAKKLLNAGKAVGRVLTEPNTIANGGGLSSYLVPRRLTAPGAAIVLGGMGTISLANEGIKGRNKALMGKVSYVGGPARMTGSYTSGAVDAMHRASGGNYAAFSDMAEEVVQSRGVTGVLDTYGATPALISSLYNMGGR